MNRNFRQVDTCTTCKHGVMLYGFEEETTYFCNLDKTYREEYLVSLSILKSKNLTIKDHAFRTLWEDHHRVEQNTVCDDYSEGNQINVDRLEGEDKDEETK